jgi:hypothetical protein
MWWIAYVALVINLITIWLMPKRLTKTEIYVTWFVIACVNLSTDIIMALYLDLYEIDQPGIQLRVHLLELTLSPSYGIIYLNFMPPKVKAYILYLVAWLIYSVLFEWLLVLGGFFIYKGWKLWYSPFYYLLALLFIRWHLHFIRKKSR